MEDYIFIGKIVNTHGIKGELRILSNFKYKNKVFVQNRRIYIGECKDEEIIVTYRKHKIFDMITMEGYNNINDVLKFLNKDVYVKKNDIDLGDGEYLDEDLIDLSILLDNENRGRVLAIKSFGSNKVIEVLIDGKVSLIPYHKDFIKNIDFINKTIEFSLIEGMI